MILSADVGGTKTTLGLFRLLRGKLTGVREATYPSAEFPGLEAIVEEFLSHGRQKLHACAVGVAGPVVGGRCQITNLPWNVDARRIARSVGVEPVLLLNDLEATAWGLAGLSPRKLASLTPGLRGAKGNAALIAAGTGLGAAILVWDGERHRPVAGEGGHQGFAPRDDLEIALLRHLRRQHGRVSVERVVSGPGLSEIHEFLVDESRAAVPGQLAPAPEAGGDPNAAIVAAARRGNLVARKALEMFVSIYGAAAGDLALVSKAVAGVYVGGGIAPQILPELRSGEFVRSFRNKGRLGAFMERIPIRVILETRTVLIGAAMRANAQARSAPRRRSARRKR